MEIVNHRIAKKFYMHAWKCKFKFNSKNKQSLKVILFVPVLVEIKTIVLKINSALIRICICIHLIDYQLFQEKSKEKKTIPGRKEEEKTRKKLTITETQVMDNLFF